MILGRNEVPFPDNPHCKRCLSKNCRELLVQPLFPGKVIFVHRRNFCSIPDYVPSWRDEENGAAVEEAALTDDLEIVSGPVSVTNPRWEHKKKAEEEDKDKAEAEAKEEEKEEDAEKKATFGDTIILMADVTGMSEGAGITFDIFETSRKPPMRVDTAKGKIQGGVGRGEWVVTDKSGKGAESKLEFEGIAKSKASVKAPINLVKQNVWGICKDIDDIAVANRPFRILKNDENVYSGITDGKGRILAPFEYTSEHQLCMGE
ncbi:MAG: hypothetical protein JW915_05495 [Chitinispirillaceae bacterium]|nr:hypothetical protein [Chitinispirillaceae bacterium]